MKNIILILLFTFTCQVLASAQGSIEKNKKAAILFMEEGMGKAKHLELHTSDFLAHAGKRSYNLQEDYAAAIENLKAFPDMEVKVTQIIAEGNNVVVHWKATGTNTGTNVYIPVATNKKGEVEGITIFRMIDGKIAEEWGLTDFISILLNWGLIKTS
jgi:predicted ester cyclase